MNFPYLQTNNKEISTAYRLAIATLAANILPFQDGILTRPEPVIIAGLGYSTPWTRDAAINIWNAGALICPEISRSTLESVPLSLLPLTAALLFALLYRRRPRKQ